MTYDDALSTVIQSINDLLKIECAFVSDESTLSDFLWGDTPENNNLATQLGVTLGVPVKRKDYIVEIAQKVAVADVLLGAYHPDGIAHWFNRPRAQLNNRTPLEAISSGDYELVMGLASSINNGGGT